MHIFSADQLSYRQVHDIRASLDDEIMRRMDEETRRKFNEKTIDQYTGELKQKQNINGQL
jgi:hypothetical protein